MDFVDFVIFVRDAGEEAISGITMMSWLPHFRSRLEEKPAGWSGRRRRHATPRLVEQ